MTAREMLKRLRWENLLVWAAIVVMLFFFWRATLLAIERQVAEHNDAYWRDQECRYGVQP